ncbi:hypothetical protein BU24DRAFT_98601 [Aaosphaeria arxii CBS 175.79]|uniref:DUF4112 domain-containing protein n=1 Tax=Aaosphaeria arxii CBS 175.79 TaxID=1450172 RepID=A0A6A5X6H7_9PLEO|nr:uncharacterized protein BU24DRAFT_98601 [Aaosphaeria arxii CBS 175.79]KAF2008384.1 hypothetical protein BU24DRAFT_98601 [Aaosphaeria arxii CBS 175.79]
MTQLIAKYAAKKMLSSELNKYKDKKVGSQYDPFYEEIPHPRKPGKTKKVKRQIPAYIPEHDANILARARKTAYRLDMCLFNFMGVRFGWSSVVGIVPAVGDALDAGFAAKLIWSMSRCTDGLPVTVIIMMLFNLALDFLVGLVPFVGDIADAAYKCNAKNVRLFEEHLDKKYKSKELIAEEKRLNRLSYTPATIYEDFSDEEEERRNTFADDHDEVRHPTRAYSGRRNERIRDEEMAIPSRNDTHRSQRSHRDGPSRNNTRDSRRH